MPVSTDVKLSVNVRPRFPKRCIVCSGREPDARTSVGDLMIGWFSFFTDIPEGWGSITVPVHKKCNRPFKLRRWLTRIGYIALAGVLCWLFGNQIDALFPVAFRQLGRKITVGAMMVPVCLIEVFFPPRFDITVSKYYITFWFADKGYAAAFAKRNDERNRYKEICGELLVQEFQEKIRKDAF